MPGFDTVDGLEIDAPAQVLFDIILDYPRVREWYHRHEADVIGGGDVVEGAQLQHVLAAKGSPVKSRFTRTIQRITPPKGRDRWERRRSSGVDSSESLPGG